MRFMRFDRKSAYISDLTPLQAKRTRNVDGTDKLALVTFDELDKGDRVVARDSMGRWCEWVVASSDVQRSNSVPVCTANCMTSLSELSGKFIPDLRRGTGGTVLQALSKALQGTRWVTGTLASGTADYSFYHVSALEAVQSICDEFGVEAYATVTLNSAKTAISSRAVNLVSRRGSESATKRFEYGRDLTDIRRTVSADDVVTRLYGYGKGIEKTDDDGNLTGGYSRKITFADVNGGKAYVEDASLLQTWGVMGPNGTMQHAEGVFEDGECDDPRKLLAETKAALKERSVPTVSYEATVLALGQAGMDADGVDVGDAVQIVDTAFPEPLRLSGRVLEIEEDMLGSLSDTKITLGNVIESARKRSQAVQQALNQLTGHASSWDEAATLGSDYLNGVIDGLNGVLNATGGYVYLKQGQGLFVYDRPEDQNPTMCIQLGGGYFRIADGKTSSGAWNFRTLGNGHGLVADALYAGIIRGGSNSWNLTTGDLSFSQGSISNKNGQSRWNLTDNTLVTQDMTANSMTANGTFRCGSTSSYGILLNGLGQLAGYRLGKQVGYIDYSASSVNLSTGVVGYGIQMQAQDCIRISVPEISVKNSSSISDVTTICRTIDQTYVSDIQDSGDTIRWWKRTLKVINGLVTVT